MREVALPPEVRRVCLWAAAVSALPLLRLSPWWLAAVLLAVALLAAFTSVRQPWPPWLRVLLTFALTGLAVAATEFRFGRDTGCALLLAMLALKVAEARTLRDARSLVGFGLFATFASFLQDQGPLTLLLALPALAITLDAFAHLAAAQAGAPTVRIAWQQRLRRMGAMLALALPLALAGFWFYPRMGTPMWGVPENAVGKTGISGSMSPGDWLDVLTDDSPAFRVRFDGAPPPRTQMYWRGPVLWNFDGRTWRRLSGISGGKPTAIAAGATRYRYELTLEPTEKRYLFALDWPLRAPANEHMGGDLSPWASEPVRAIARYRLTSSSDARIDAELPALQRRYALQLPAGFNPRTRALALQWRDEGADDAQVIQRALAWIHRDFTYTLAAPPLGRNSVDEFLYDTREGFCEHFSSSFVFLMRAAGIPARVVTGYVGGYRNPMGDYWVIQQSDAHAWAEVWLAGRGWVRVDPTAAVDPARVFERYGSNSGIASFGGALAPMLNLGDWLRRGWNDVLLSYDVTRQQLLLRAMGIEQAQNWQAVAVFATIAALALALTLWWLNRRTGAAPDPVLRAWRRLVRRLQRAGLQHPRSEPAQAYAERAARRWPALAPQLHSLSARFASWRYAGADSTPAAARELIRDLDRLRVPRRAEPSRGDAP